MNLLQVDFVMPPELQVVLRTMRTMLTSRLILFQPMNKRIKNCLDQGFPRQSNQQRVQKYFKILLASKIWRNNYSCGAASIWRVYAIRETIGNWNTEGAVFNMPADLHNFPLMYKHNEACWSQFAANGQYILSSIRCTSPHQFDQICGIANMLCIQNNKE